VRVASAGTTIGCRGGRVGWRPESSPPVPLSIGPHPLTPSPVGRGGTHAVPPLRNGEGDRGSGVHGRGSGGEDITAVAHRESLSAPAAAARALAALDPAGLADR